MLKWIPDVGQKNEYVTKGTIRIFIYPSVDLETKLQSWTITCLSVGIYKEALKGGHKLRKSEAREAAIETVRLKIYSILEDFTNLDETP